MASASKSRHRYRQPIPCAQHQRFARYRVIFEKSSLGIVLLGTDCLVAEANEAMHRLSGWSPEELVGRKACSELFVADREAAICAAICHPHLLHAGVDPNFSHRLLLRTENGMERPVMVSTAPVPLTRSKTGLAVFLWDATEAEQIERELALRKRKAEDLAAIGREISAASDIAHHMEPILNRARRLVGMDLVAWGDLDEVSQSLVWESAAGPGSYELKGARMNLAGSLMGQILLQGRTYLTMNFTEEQSGDREVYRSISRPPLTTAMIIPFAVRAGRQAVLLCASRLRMAVTEEDVMLASYLGSCLSTAVENSLLVEEVKRIATLEERQRLVGEMHDGFGQLLTYLGLRLHLIGKLAKRGETAAIEREVADLKSILHEAHQGVRATLFDLKKSAPTPSPMADRWQKLLDDFAGRTGIRVEYQADPGATERIPEAVQAQLTRILQEALANVRNHSGAYCVKVQVKRVEHELRVVVTDDGCGFDPATARGIDRHHFGLTLMAERAAGIGATLDIRSQRGHGTTIAIGWSFKLEGERYEPI